MSGHWAEGKRGGGGAHFEIQGEFVNTFQSPLEHSEIGSGNTEQMLDMQVELITSLSSDIKKLYTEQNQPKRIF